MTTVALENPAGMCFDDGARGGLGLIIFCDNFPQYLNTLHFCFPFNISSHFYLDFELISSLCKGFLGWKVRE